MKKMKRIVAVLLTGVMALTMLTACGSKIIPIERNDAVEKTVSAIAEKYEIGAMTNAETVETLDKLANDFLDELVKDFTESSYPSFVAISSQQFITGVDTYWAKITSSTVGTSSKTFALPVVGLSEYQAIAYYELILDNKLEDSNIPAGCEYFAQVYHVTNPANAEDGMWFLFSVVIAPET